MGCIGKCAINENNHVCCLECQDYKDCPMRCDSSDEYVCRGLPGLCGGGKR